MHGDPGLILGRPVPAGSGDANDITFAQDSAHLAVALQSNVGVVITSHEAGPQSKTTISVTRPREAFGVVLSMFQRPLPIASGIHPTAVVSEKAEIDPSACIGPYTVIEGGTEIGAHVRVHAHCYIGDGCRVGEDSIIYPNVTIYQDITIGRRCIVHAGAVLGADGFGFIWDGHKRVKIPQIGGLDIGDDVEIGANACLDRATVGRGRIENGVKLDNLVQVAHNVIVGEHCALASQVGISGSVTIGPRVVFGGQAGVADHHTIAADVTLGGRSGVINDIPEPGQYFGLPTVPFGQAMKTIAFSRRLPELFKRVRALERAGKDGSGE